MTAKRSNGAREASDTITSLVAMMQGPAANSLVMSQRFALEAARPEDYHALLLPGGVMNPDRLRMNAEAVQFVKSFMAERKPVAVICHGPWTLIEADAVQGRRITSWPSLRTDLENAGADWVDEPVVVDQGLVSSRKPDDIPAFNAKMIEEFREGRHVAQRAA